MFSRLAQALMFSLLLAAMGGCKSISSTMLMRSSDDTFYGNSNGASKHHGQPRPFNGVPVALEVPTHVDLEIVETYYIARYETTEGGNKVYRLSEVDFESDSARNLDVIAHPVSTKKLFTVDFVRPAAGMLSTDIQFSEDQYLKSFKNKIVDQTIQDITASIQKLTPLLTKKTAADIGTSIGATVLVNTRTVAYQRFDIDEPDFEQQMLAFVQHHLNDCHNCQGRQQPESNAAAVGLIGRER